MKRAVVWALTVVGASVALALPSAAAGSVAPGSPGSQSYFDLARKDCVGTARNTASKVWFTVADGVLSDVYWPTVDATNVHTLQYVVTDGSTFTDLQTRDMTYRVLGDRTGMECTIIARPVSTGHSYTITTTYVADPARDAVLVRTRFSGPSSDRLYVRLDPLAGGTGGGGPANAGGNSAVVDGSTAGGPDLVAFNTNTHTNALNRDYAVPTYEAVAGAGGEASVGYADSASDGLQMLDSARALTPYDSAPDGHVVLTQRVQRDASGTAVLALGFGQTQADAVAAAGASAAQPFDSASAAYLSGWHAYDAHLRRPPSALSAAAAREYYESVNVVKASEDKTFPGAIAAGLASPWGQAVPAGNFSGGKPTYFGSYREVFARDLYEAFAGLLVAGDVATARDATRFLFDRQQLPDGSMPRNSLTNGKPAPDTGGNQLDETSYPILMDWQSGLASDGALYRDHVIPAADYLLAHGPSFGVERWEEQSGYSPSTIAAEIAGLTAAARIAQVNGDPGHARIYQATADDFARNIKAWTVTTSGPYAPRYFIRVSKAGDPNAAITYNLGNGSIDADQRSVVDAGFLELVRLGILPATDAGVRDSLGVVDREIERTVPTGTGFYRYGTSDPGSEDGYGDCWTPDLTNCPMDGQPWPTTDMGSGHLWPVLSGERGEYDVAAGHASAARRLLQSMRAMTSGQGLEPEQAWEDPPLAASPFGSDPTIASIGFSTGRPAGSASPLTWAQSQYARLTLALGAGRDLETPGITVKRYVTNGMPGALPVTITSPSSGSLVSPPSVTVTGTTVRGARVDVEGETATGGTAALRSGTADAAGHFTFTVPIGFGTTVITVGATKGSRTGYAQASVVNVTLPGTLVLNAADPTGDDNGPGTYAYPTDSRFQPGAFDLTAVKVSEDSSSVYIQVSLANLAPTFGSSFGAQLLDVYVRNPAVGAMSTAAAYPELNYSIASSDAWTERIEAQGFAPVAWVDAAGNSLGSGQLVADQTSKTATVVLPRAAFGNVSAGWVFTVTLTGQGSGSPPVRTFTATPGQFTFGVCAPGGMSSICAADPNTVPKVMDTVPPSGVSQATELDPTAGPVVLQGVAVP